VGDLPADRDGLVHGAPADPRRAPAARRALNGILERFALLGARPSDTDEERLRKGALVLTAALITLVSFTWVGTYLALGLWPAALIPAAYQVVTVGAIAFLARTKRYEVFRATQLGMMLVLPFVLQWSLGGFVDSSAVCLWALVSPLAALVFHGPRQAIPWFGAFVFLLAASAGVEGSLPDRGDAIPGWLATAFFALNLAAPSLTAFAILQHFVRLLGAERERSERLLLNILPAPIADRLKRSRGVIAERSEEVSVLFADLAGFTPAVEHLAPERVVALLDEIFSAFDELVESCGLEKIKTLGDGYMVASGIPAGRADHASAAAELALAMRDALAEIPAAAGFALRVGIDSGPVVAGVIGRSKFGYDLWGDTVNTASRMQSHAPAGAIQVTERAHKRLEGAYVFERREEVDVKGKGSLTTYLLLGRR
jgi:adenylate cyclase